MRGDTFAAAGVGLSLALVLCAERPAFVAAASSVSLAAPASPSQSSPIEQAVATYRDGDQMQAATSVLRWSSADIDAAVQTLSRAAFVLAGTKYPGDGIGLADIEAALVLHTDVAVLAAEYDLHQATAGTRSTCNSRAAGAET